MAASLILAGTLETISQSLARYFYSHASQNNGIVYFIFGGFAVYNDSNKSLSTITTLASGYLLAKTIPIGRSAL